MSVQLSQLLAAERRIEALARPHGVVDRQQLLGAGFSAPLIDRRVKAGWLRPMHRGVYAVGSTQSAEAPEMAAALACREGAVVSHRSAAALWRLMPKPLDAPVEVTVGARHAPRRRGVRVHRIPFHRDEATRLRRIPVTRPARTLFDLAACVPARELEQALAKAERSNLTTRAKLSALLARYPARPGTPKLRELLSGPRDPAFTRSEAEERFLALARRARLPTPETNVALHGYELDFFWPEGALAVEVDGYEFHGDRGAFEADRRRDAELATHGIQVIRTTWRQIAADSEATVALVAQALALRA